MHPFLSFVGLVGFALLFEGVYYLSKQLATAISDGWSIAASTDIVLMLGFWPMGMCFVAVIPLAKWLLVGRVRAGALSLA